ncbi:MAG: hypothetical protein HYU64_15615 [Armatimonadetes bacterium]|nr:hypothetical protein [Armatimonadota bacterium]
MKLIPLDPGEQNTFIGMAACKKCHEQTVQFFEDKVKHAKAVATLDDEALLKKHNLKREDRCIGCHKVGGSDSRGVECEGCHGPAAVHAEVPAKELKKRDYAIGRIAKPDEAWCRKCHNKNSPEFKEFDYKKAYEKIKHKLPPKK